MAEPGRMAWVNLRVAQKVTAVVASRFFHVTYCEPGKQCVDNRQAETEFRGNVR